jgi:hypothetical protein
MLIFVSLLMASAVVSKEYASLADSNFLVASVFATGRVTYLRQCQPIFEVGRRMMWHSFPEVRDECAKGSPPIAPRNSGRVSSSLRCRSIRGQFLSVEDNLPGWRAGVCVSHGEEREHGATSDQHSRYDLRRPGSYALNVVYSARYAPAGKSLPVAAMLSHQEFEKRLEIVLASSRPENLKPEFEAYARALDSPDWRKRKEPATVIAYLAPAFMEPTILRMLHTPGMQSFGVEGLRNLGTPSAHRALAEFVRDSSPTKIPALYQRALRYLGEIGNSGDVPVLLKAAHTNALDSYSRELAIESAGEAGGAAAVSSLETELQDRSMDMRLDVVQALPLTGSRAAVPVLIRLLQSPEDRISSFAEYGLEALTHLRGAKMDGIQPPPPAAYSRWIRWWMTDGQTATIFRPDQCGEIKPIPFS